MADQEDPDDWLPCPFCGIDDLRMLEGSPSGRAIGCASCGAVGPSAEDADEAVMNWNDRTSDHQGSDAPLESSYE